MTSSEFHERLTARAENAGVPTTPDVQTQLEAYFHLLMRWNAKINLTALPLGRPTDETFDRLLVEPLAAAKYFADSDRVWFDLGSGGGSPAIPLKIAQPRTKLTMIESRTRKAAFLREVVRAMRLADTIVEDDRFENVVARTDPHTVDLLTVRAVKSKPLFDELRGLLSPTGRAFFFHSQTTDVVVPPGFQTVEVVSLGTVGQPKLSIIKPVFHVEQSD